MTLRIAWFGHAGGRRADGLTAYSDQTVAALVASGCAVRFFHQDLDGERTPVADAVALPGGRFKTVTMPPPRTITSVRRALADFSPEVVHLSLSVSLLDGAVARAGRSLGAVTVATCHLPYARAHSARGRVMRGLYRFHATRLRHFDRIIALSSDQRDLLVTAGLDPGRIVVMPNAVDTDRIAPGTSALPDRLGSELIVTFLGRLDPEKRVEELARSFIARGWPPDRLLLIAGSGSQERKLHALAARHPSLRVLGMVTSFEERLDLLRATDIFVLPSTAEGLSLSLLEAMAAGCAIIATDAGEHGAVLDGAGEVIPAHPLEPGLGEALARLGADPEQRVALGGAARRRVLAQHSLAAYVQDLIRLYEATMVERASLAHRRRVTAGERAAS